MEYKYSDYEVEKLSPGYKFHELFMYGKDKDIFELRTSPVADFVGMRIVLKESFDDSLIIKKVDSYNTDASDSLVVPYGALTAGTWARVRKKKKRVPINAAIAISRIVGNKPVIIEVPKSSRSITVSNPSFDLDELGVYDFEDLSKLNFFMEI